MNGAHQAASGVQVVSFGCRLNIAESQTIRDAMSNDGCEDVVVFNTCAVTGEAVRQARQGIRALKRRRPASRVVVTGCAAQTEPHAFAAMPEVDLVLGNETKTEPDVWRGIGQATGAAERLRVSDIMATRGPLRRAVTDRETHTRAFVQVQNGCDHRCTFCIIPFGRGRSRSVPARDVVETVARLVERGVLEVVLTGVDITSYGFDLPGTSSLGALVGDILRDNPSLRRLRLSSLDCVEIDPLLRDHFGQEERLMPHAHLSLQSGDDLILKRMKRRHDRRQAVALCADLRRRRADIVLGADFIVGFPTETEDRFLRTLDMVEACGLTHLHVFPYSPRPETPAARMPQVPRAVAKARAERLREVGARQMRAHLVGKVGQTFDVLTERGGIGRLADFTRVRVAGLEPGRLARVTITGHDGAMLEGRAA
jgi:threonylcarbamoyladenosine tRNA methylthiotransferase MtaB